MRARFAARSLLAERAAAWLCIARRVRRALAVTSATELRYLAVRALSSNGMHMPEYLRVAAHGILVRDFELVTATRLRSGTVAYCAVLLPPYHIFS